MMKKIFFIVILALLLAFSAIVIGNKYFSKPKKISLPETIIESEKAAEVQKQEDLKQEELKKEEHKIPEKTLIKVPFMSQAPSQIWDALHEDACEETSLIMVKDFIQKKPVGTIADQEKEIKDLVKYETKNGYGPSITLEQLNRIAKDYYGLNSGRVEKNVTIDGIKKELAAGRPVIVGAAGKVLPNPNFKNGGPNYHMLAVKGYENGYFITNDPGTRKGENFKYTFDDLYKSIHDWNAKNILNGQKNYLVFD